MKGKLEVLKCEQWVGLYSEMKFFVMHRNLSKKLGVLKIE